MTTMQDNNDNDITTYCNTIESNPIHIFCEPHFPGSNLSIYVPFRNFRKKKKNTAIFGGNHVVFIGATGPEAADAAGNAGNGVRATDARSLLAQVSFENLDCKWLITIITRGKHGWRMAFSRTWVGCFSGELITIDNHYKPIDFQPFIGIVGSYQDLVQW